MKPRRFIAHLILFLVAAPALLYSQNEAPKRQESYKVKMERFKVKKKDFKKNRYLSVGGSLQFLTYFGDLAPTNNFLSTEISQINPGISGFVQYRYGPRMSLKAELLYGRLAGDDFVSVDPADLESRNRYIRNLSFRNDIFDLSIMPQFYVFKNYLDFKQRKAFNIFFNGGISVFYHNPKGKIPEFKVNDERYPNFGEWIALRPLGTEGQHSDFYNIDPYSNFQLSIPFGGGFSFKLNERLDFVFEINYRILLTDYIDDVSGRYVDPGALEGDLAKTMSDRSMEEYAIVTGEKRDLSDLEVITFVSPYDGNRYKALKDRGSVRGGSGNDTYLATGFKISYILYKEKAGEK